MSRAHEIFRPSERLDATSEKPLTAKATKGSRRTRKERQVIRDLLGEAIEEIAVVRDRLLEGLHNVGAGQLLRWGHVFQIELQRFLQHMALRLAVALGGSDELFVELGVDFRGELLGCGWHRQSASLSILAHFMGKSRYILICQYGYITVCRVEGQKPHFWQETREMGQPNFYSSQMRATRFGSG